MAMLIVSKIRDEWQKSPVAFIAATLGSLTVIANFIAAIPSLWSAAPMVIGVDIEFVIKLCVFVLLQGAVGMLSGRGHLWLYNKGEGFPYVLMAASSILCLWLAMFNVYWLAVNGNPTLKISQIGFYIGGLFSWVVMIWFSNIYFGKEKRLRLVLQGLDKQGYTLPHYDYGYWLSFWINTFSAIIFFIYFVRKAEIVWAALNQQSSP